MDQTNHSEVLSIDWQPRTKLQEIRSEGNLQAVHVDAVHGPGVQLQTKSKGNEEPVPNGESLPDSDDCNVSEDGQLRGLDFAEKSIRRGFIRKVYAILMCQLLVTLCFLALFVFHRPTKKWMYDNKLPIYIISVILMIGCYIAICFESVRRKWPTNFVLLGFVTLSVTIFLGIISSSLDTVEVMIAVGVTAAVCLVQTLFAFQTKWDFTVLGGVLVSVTTIFLMYGIICIFVPRDGLIPRFFIAFGVFLFSFYLVYDTQLMMGGKHKYSISPEDYIFAALTLYTDIINIFLRIFITYNTSGSNRDAYGYPKEENQKGVLLEGNSPQGVYYPTPEPGFQPAGVGYEKPGFNAAAASVNGDLGEGGEVKGLDFTEKSIRRAFIKRVYAILMCQLLVTLSIIMLFVFHYETNMWARRNMMAVYVSSIVVMIVCLVAITCFESVRRKWPMNFIFLGIFTLSVSFMVGIVSCLTQIQAVMIAVGLTAAVCLGLTLFAFQTKWDFTVLGGALLSFLIILILFGIICIFVPRNSLLQLVYAALGTLLFSFYLVYDTQLMMGGKHKYSISPEEYIFAALNLYMDIINIFLHILSMARR